MTKQNEILSQSDLADIEQRVERVLAHMKQSTSSWLSIAAEFAAAKSKLRKLAYERFANDAGFTTSVADKLAKIGSCPDLYVERNLEAITSIEGWTVLYALATLEPKQRDSLLKHIKTSDMKITREVIFNFVNNKPLADKRFIVASIEIDEQKLKTLTQEQFSLVQQRLKSLESEINKLNAGVLIKQRAKVIDQINNLATANSNALVIKTAA